MSLPDFFRNETRVGFSHTKGPPKETASDGCGGSFTPRSYRKHHFCFHFLFHLSPGCCNRAKSSYFVGSFITSIFFSVGYVQTPPSPSESPVSWVPYTIPPSDLPSKLERTLVPELAHRAMRFREHQALFNFMPSVRTGHDGVGFLGQLLDQLCRVRRT